MNISCPEPTQSEKFMNKPSSDLYRENWEKIFGGNDKKKEQEKKKKKTNNE